MLKVIIADDHAILREGLRGILSSTDDMQVIGEAGNHAEIIKLLRSQRCDVLLLDIAMPGKNGIDTLKQVKNEWPTLPVLMLSMYPEDQYAVRALKAGASGYLTKASAPGQLVEAIRQVTRGRKFITPELAQSIAESINTPTSGSPHEDLSDREFQTMRLIASGKTLSQIAGELSISPKTVSVYRARVLAKLQLANNAELTRYALEHGLVE
jgi:DNA-binding NarL/FixJ family response regulator